MKHVFHSWFHFTKAQSRGVLVLSLICFVLLIHYAFMDRLYGPPPPHPKEKEWIAAWERHKALYALKEEREDGWVPTTPAELFPFDPNTLDSAGFIRLGLRPKTVRMLLNWRRKGKTFYRPEDLKPLYTLKEEEYTRLAPFIRITSVAARKPFTWQRQEPLPDIIPLNTTDSATLVRLNGIGPTLAHRILERRNLLGGYLRHEQLLEVYRFPDTTFNMLRDKLKIEPATVKKLPLNQATLEELSRHPYIGEKIAKNILMLREGLGKYRNIEQLRQVPLMNEENYRKIAPYFTLD